MLHRKIDMTKLFSPTTIRAASHPLARLARDLGKGLRERREHGLFLIEGPRALDEALRAEAPLAWVMIAADRADDPRLAAALSTARARDIAVQSVASELLVRLAPTEHGPGLLAACRLPSSCDDPAALLRAGTGLAVVIWQPVQPGNVGTLIRSAAAFGARGVVVVGGADPWNEKSVRASAGAIHRIAVARAEESSMTSFLLEQGVRVAAAVAHGGVDPRQADWSQFDVLLLGSETQGVPPALSASATTLTIPLAGGVESLGVAMAGTVLLSLAHRIVPA